MENMINGLGTMASACRGIIHRLDTTVNNIANVNTTGFKAEQLFFFSESSEGVPNTGEVAPQPVSSIDYSPGDMYKTGNALELALGGSGFFAIQTEDGMAYTRDGRFKLNKDRELTTIAGDYVLGRSGKIVIAGDNIQIGGRGDIRADGRSVGALMILDFENEAALVRSGRNLFRDPDNRAVAKKADNPGIQQGYLENSNVQSIKEMVTMINIQRSFESYQKIVQTIQDQDKLSTNRIGKL